MKDSDLAQQIAQSAGLQCDVEDSKVVHDYVIQNNLTDYDFLIQRAALAGYRFFVDDTTLTFKTPQVSGESVATLTWMQNIGRFVQEVNTFDQVSKVTPTGWDPQQKQAPTPQSAQGGDETGTMGGTTTGAQLVKKMFGEVGEGDRRSRAGSRTCSRRWPRRSSTARRARSSRQRAASRAIRRFARER